MATPRPEVRPVKTRGLCEEIERRREVLPLGLRSGRAEEVLHHRRVKLRRLPGVAETVARRIGCEVARDGDVEDKFRVACRAKNVKGVLDRGWRALVGAVPGEPGMHLFSRIPRVEVEAVAEATAITLDVNEDRFGALREVRSGLFDDRAAVQPVNATQTRLPVVQDRADPARESAGGRRRRCQGHADPGRGGSVAGRIPSHGGQDMGAVGKRGRG